MVINARAWSHRSSCRRTTALVAAAAAAVVGIAASTPAASAAPPEPFLFSYTFNRHLKLGGGNFTMNGEVHVYLRFSPQNTFWSQSVIARPHQVTPGGDLRRDEVATLPAGKQWIRTRLRCRHQSLESASTRHHLRPDRQRSRAESGARVTASSMWVHTPAVADKR
jgi:hypothetical protein